GGDLPWTSRCLVAWFLTTRLTAVPLTPALQASGTAGRVNGPLRVVAEPHRHVDLDRVALQRGDEAGELLDDREVAERQVIEAVASFEEGRDATAAERVSEPIRLPRQAAKALGRRAHASMGIGGGCVLAGGHEDEVGAESFHRGRDDLLERVPVPVVAGARGGTIPPRLHRSEEHTSELQSP